MKKILLTAVLTTVFLLTAKGVLASEGFIDLTNRINTDSRCSAFSVFEQDLRYHIQYSCRDITYPGGIEVVNYILWSNPVSGGNAVKIGEIGLGKGHFTTIDAFSSLFVTVERDRNTRTPVGQTIMQGNVKTIANLESKFTPRPTEQNNTTEITPTLSPTPTAVPQSGVAKFLTGGIIAFIALFAVIFVIFVITRR